MTASHQGLLPALDAAVIWTKLRGRVLCSGFLGFKTACRSAWQSQPPTAVKLPSANSGATPACAAKRATTATGKGQLAEVQRGIPGILYGESGCAAFSCPSRRDGNLLLQNISHAEAKGLRQYRPCVRQGYEGSAKPMNSRGVHGRASKVHVVQFLYSCREHVMAGLPELQAPAASQRGRLLSIRVAGRSSMAHGGRLQMRQ